MAPAMAADKTRACEQAEAEADSWTQRRQDRRGVGADRHEAGAGHAEQATRHDHECAEREPDIDQRELDSRSVRPTNIGCTIQQGAHKRKPGSVPAEQTPSAARQHGNEQHEHDRVAEIAATKGDTHGFDHADEQAADQRAGNAAEATEDHGGDRLQKIALAHVVEHGVEGEPEQNAGAAAQRAGEKPRPSGTARRECPAARDPAVDRDRRMAVPSGSVRNKEWSAAVRGTDTTMMDLRSAICASPNAKTCSGRKSAGNRRLRCGRRVRRARGIPSTPKVVIGGPSSSCSRGRSGRGRPSR